MKESCNVCDHRTRLRCPENSLYVVTDPMMGLTKIGMSRRVVRRLAVHRKSRPAVVLAHRQEAGCEHECLQREAAALTALEAICPRIVGDWFQATPEQAIACVISSMDATP